MVDILQALTGTVAKPAPFSPGSRYYGIGTSTLQTPDGKTIVYVRRRFLPSADRFTVVQAHTVTAADRIDNLAATYLGDSEQYWRICDANEAMDPSVMLAEPGSTIAIALPEGFGGWTGA